MQSQNYFYTRLLKTPIDLIIEAVEKMPTMTEKRRQHIRTAIAKAQICYACEDLGNWLHSALTMQELGIDQESAIWQQWEKLKPEK